jgi:hypothetical protein
MRNAWRTSPENVEDSRLHQLGCSEGMSILGYDELANGT